MGASEELKDGGLDGGLVSAASPRSFPHYFITQVLGRGDGLDGVHGLLEHGLGDDGRLHDHALGGLAPPRHGAAPRLPPQRPRRAVMFPLPIPLWCISIRVTLIPCRYIHYTILFIRDIQVSPLWPGWWVTDSGPALRGSRPVKHVAVEDGSGATILPAVRY